MLTLENLSFSYPSQDPLFSGLSADIEPGQVLAIVGRNGAGKSTLLRLLNGLLRPTSGDIQVRGTSTKERKIHEIARDIGTLFQTPEQQLFASRVLDEVAFGPRQLKLSQAETEDRVTRALRITHLHNEAARHPLDLSMAERRFTALASVLAMNPAALLLDEPQRGLDHLWTGRLELIIASEKAAGKAIVLICHDMDFVARNADHVLALGTGETPKVQATDAFFRDKSLLRRAHVDAPTLCQLKALLPNEATRPPSED